ncbi:hypothetical protein, partial [Halochromatium roseum]|uniref:hypothetical protein n=1 Tax=Halochromatium roseum TaxID=391920 RepID=UPI001A90F1A9
QVHRAASPINIARQFEPDARKCPDPRVSASKVRQLGVERFRPEGSGFGYSAQVPMLHSFLSASYQLPISFLSASYQLPIKRTTGS